MVRKTRSASRFFFSLAIFALLGLVCILIAANGKKWYDRYTQEKAINALKNEIARLKTEEAQQTHFLEELKSPFAIEREGREKLNAKKPGEKVVLFPKFEDEEGSLGQEHGDVGRPFFREWFQYFFH